MPVPQPVMIVRNPNDPEQRYVLWSNGRIDNFGGAPPVTGWQGWYDRIDPVACDIHIIDWEDPSGYIFDFQGGFIPFGGAPTITTTVDGATVNLNGLPYVGYRRYGSWSWDPSGSGQGYAVDLFGEILPFGGAPSPPRTGPRWSYPAVRAFAMNWTGTKRALTLDYSGGLHADFNSVTISGAPYWPYMDVAWDVVVTEWSATPKGYVLDHNRRVWPFGGAPDAFGYPYTPSYVGRLLEVLSPADPLRLWQVDALGAHHEWTASTKPSVNIVSPAAEVTATTRPLLAWTYSDPQQDSQTEVAVLVFTQAFADAHTMSDPAVHAASALVDETVTNSATRGIACPVDLPNGDYVEYVRVLDSSDLWSDWDSLEWTQNVPLPATPTGMTATVAGSSVNLSVTAATGGVATLVRFEFSDDPAAASSPGTVTWYGVDGATAVPIAATTTAVDRFAPQGKPRTHRALAYAVDPQVTSTPSTPAAAVTVPVLGHLLHAVDDPSLGGALKVQGMQETRTSKGGAFDTLDDDWPTVVKDGSAPRAIRGTIELLTMDSAAWDLVDQLALSRSTLVLRRPFGDVRYVEILGDWNRQQVRAAALKVENTPLRNMHTTGLSLVEVRPPHLAA